METGPRRGVYFLANDVIIDLAIAFLNSFRTSNPDLPLRLIPFDAGIRRLAELQATYRFTIYADEEVLRQCDAIGARFHGRVVGHYRKLAAWCGQLDEFIYIDTDTVVLEDVGFVFSLLRDHEFVASHSNLRKLRQWVWKDSILETGALSPEQVEYSASMGFVASRRGAIDLDTIGPAVDRAVRLAPHMAPRCFDQPLLNYLIVTSGRSYTSLLVLARFGEDRSIPLERWAGSWGGVVREGTIGFGGRRVLLLHWAGEWQPRWLDRALRGLLRLVGLERRGEGNAPRLLMPYRRLWRRYRLMDPPAVARGGPAANLAQ
jgi:hypothetical protein